MYLGMSLNDTEELKKLVLRQILGQLEYYAIIMYRVGLSSNSILGSAAACRAIICCPNGIPKESKLTSWPFGKWTSEEPPCQLISSTTIYQS